MPSTVAWKDERLQLPVLGFPWDTTSGCSSQASQAKTPGESAGGRDGGHVASTLKLRSRVAGGVL